LGDTIIKKTRKIFVILDEDGKIYPAVVGDVVVPRTFFYKTHAKRFCKGVNRAGNKIGTERRKLTWIEVPV